MWYTSCSQPQERTRHSSAAHLLISTRRHAVHARPMLSTWPERARSFGRQLCGTCSCWSYWMQHCRSGRMPRKCAHASGLALALSLEHACALSTSYASQHYSKTSRASFTNNPTDAAGLRAAVDAAWHNKESKWKSWRDSAEPPPCSSAKPIYEHY